jgi:polyisoprenoid-binding protein YceI
MTANRRRRAVSGFLLALLAGSAQAQPPAWRVDRGDLRIVVPLKPGGAFNATSSSLEGTLVLGGVKPAALKGELAVDLATIDTGIGLRNQHLREKYLEIGKAPGFERAVLSDIRLPDVDREAFDGRTAFGASLRLHGVTHPIEGTAEIARQGESRRVRAEFRLTLTDFGIAPPEYLGVGVGNKLLVSVQFTATPAREGTQ